jgi:predicted DNA-binding ribbon-helix-helix protein
MAEAGKTRSKRDGAARSIDRAAMTDRPIRKRSVVVAGHATSLTVEDAFWRDLQEIAGRRGISLNALIAVVDAERRGNLSSALRVFVRDRYRCGEIGPGAD